MVTVNDLRVSNVIPVTVSELLLSEFPLCSMCARQLEEESLALIFRDSNKVLTAFHTTCETRFKGLFIQSHPKMTREQLCVILNLSRRNFFRLKGQQW